MSVVPGILMRTLNTLQTPLLRAKLKRKAKLNKSQGSVLDVWTRH